jgi:antitoxin (DNA-binding transcriptional repressor) of toxin-antitoxin stability system
MIEISLTELRVGWYRVLSGVLHGKSYIIHREGHPIAQLSPVLAAPLPRTAPERATPSAGVMLDPSIAATVGQLTGAFGLQGLAQVLGTSPVLVEGAVRTGILPPYLLARLDLLLELWSAFRASAPPREFGRWFGRPQHDLGGRSPQAVLRGAWQPDSPRVKQLLKLAAEPKHG